MDINKTPSGHALVQVIDRGSPTYVPVQYLIGSEASIGTFITFDKPRTYGIGTAESGDITLDGFEAKSGIVQLVRHNAGSEPNFGSEFVKKASYTYTTGVVNYIYLEYITSTEILVSAEAAL